MALYVVYFANYLVPLITVPYTVRVLTPAGYGRGAVALSFAAFVGVIAAYGFNLTASREVSVGRTDLHAVSRTASEVVVVELCLLAMCAGGYEITLAVVPSLCSDSSIMWIAFAAIGLRTLNPIWLYQGLEDLKFSARVGLILRLAYVPALFLLVRNPTDTPEWLALQAATAGLGAVWLWYHAYRRLGVRWVRPRWKGLVRQVREGFAIFFSMAAVSLYTSGNVFILGILTNATMAGYYSAAEKLVRAAMGAWGPLQQAVFPRITQLASESRQAGLRFAGKMLIVQGGMGAALSIGLFATAPWVVPVVLGHTFQPSITILRILAVLPFLIAVSNVLGIQVMVPFKKDGAFAAALVAAGLLNVGLAVTLVPRWQGSGMAFSVGCSEFIVTASMFLFLRRHDLVPYLRPQPEGANV